MHTFLPPNRREFLGRCGLGIGSVALANLLATEGQASTRTHFSRQGRARDSRVSEWGDVASRHV